MGAARATATFPAPGHDHGPCLADVIERAEQAFAEQGLRLTALRRTVLEEIAGSHKAVGAYDILDRLSRKGGKRLAPISVYRALDSLVAAGIVHRLESRNAFFACHAEHPAHRRQIVLSCEGCGAVAEMSVPDALDGIERAAASVGFRMSRVLVEVIGACKACSGS
jgi:Fur family zinc uptake transcriptional regulator